MLQQHSRMFPQMRQFNVGYAESLNVLAYRSVAVTPPTQSEIQNLLRASQARNRAQGLTGILLYERGAYFQWLEGPHEALSRVWRSIKRDPRHREVTVLREEPISDRVFEGWDLRFAQGDRVDIDAAISAMECSNERFVRALGKTGSILNLSVADVFQAHVLPRLQQLHRKSASAATLRSSTASIWHAGSGTAETFARLLLDSRSGDSTRYIDTLLDQGAGFDALYQEVFEPAQLQLGKFWQADVCDELHFEIGLARLQVEIRRVNAETHPVHYCKPGHSVLLSPQPMESHRIGLAMASEVFDRGGWDIVCKYPDHDRSLSEIVREQWFDVLKLFQSGAVRRDSRLVAMRDTIDLARAQSLNPSLIVLVDGRTFVERPEIFRAVHADASANALESVAVATRLLEAGRSLTATGLVTAA